MKTRQQWTAQGFVPLTRFEVAVRTYPYTPFWRIAESMKVTPGRIERACDRLINKITFARENGLQLRAPDKATMYPPTRLYQLAKLGEY